MPPTLQTKNLTKHFDGVYAVRDLSVEFRPGEITGLIGPNGSGKTTLINLLTGLTPFDAGAVYLGQDTKLRRLRPYEVSAYGLTRTFQEVRLFEQLPVLDNILLMLTERGVWPALFERHRSFHLAVAKRVLRRVGLWEKRDSLAVNLSYGQRKLLEIARALAMKAEVYFFDEPFAGLFPEMATTVAKILQELRQTGKTIILVEHNMNLIRQLSDRVVVVDSGELLAEGAPAEVLNRRKVVEAYLGE
ncbi:MAG: ABC transporter ATP-binding protein [Candidatus Vogelbacteria bacterium]|nr:ABC transporter ATP-binding protein [Candidatus Vogelbacteria bacterium]